MSDKMAHYNHGFGKEGVSIRSMPVLSTHAGAVQWVDSAGSVNGTGSYQRPWTTIDAAVGACTANSGDMIFVKPGHAETVSAAAGLDLDVAGITIVFLGNGNDRGTITFGTATTADMDVDAADITMVNPRFVAGIDALAGPIDVNAARFKIFGGTYEDGTTINTTDAVVADANADDLLIDGLTFIDGDAAGTQKQSFIQVAGATRPTLRNIRCTGDFGTGIIENGTAWIDATLEELVLDNASATPTVCVFLSATSTGWFRKSALRVASGSTGYTASNTMQIAPDVVVTGTDGNVAADPTIGNLEDTAATGAVTTTDTLMSYVKQIVTQLGGADADTNAIASMLSGSAGIATMPNAAVPANAVNLFEMVREIWAVLNGTAAGENGVQSFPTAAAAANNVSLAEVIRYISEYQVPRVVSKAIAAAGISLTTGASPVSLFTVTGDVKARVFAVVTTALASTLNNGTLAIGVSGNTGGFMAATTADGTNFATNTVWAGDTSPTLLGEVLSNGSLNWVLVGNGADIIATVATNSMTAGAITFYCEYIPLTSSSTVVAA